MLAIQLLVLIISTFGLESVFSIPSFGFNLPPLGIDGKNLDYRETSPRFFSGDVFSDIYSIKFGFWHYSTDLFKHSTSMKEISCCGDDAGIQVCPVHLGFAEHALRNLQTLRWRDFQAQASEQVIGFIMVSQLSIKHSGGRMDILRTWIDGNLVLRNIVHLLLPISEKEAIL